MIKFIPKTKTINQDRLYFVDNNKFIKKDSVLSRGENEAKILFLLKNVDNIPKIIDTYQDNNFNTIILEFISGETLENCINELNFEDKIFIFKELTKIVINLVEEKVVHGDINESNLIYDKINQRIYLIDFETAKLEHSLEDFGLSRGIYYIKNYLKL